MTIILTTTRTTTSTFLIRTSESGSLSERQNFHVSTYNVSATPFIFLLKPIWFLTIIMITATIFVDSFTFIGNNDYDDYYYYYRRCRHHTYHHHIYNRINLGVSASCKMISKRAILQSENSQNCYRPIHDITCHHMTSHDTTHSPHGSHETSFPKVSKFTAASQE